MYQAGWNVDEIVRAGARVELENTNWLGRGSDYHRFDVPGGGLLFPSYHLNHSFRDCDVFVSLTKLKDHTTAGVTLSMKNCFGNIPTTVYGDHTAKDAPDELPHSGRNAVFHDGARQPTSLAAPEKDPSSPRHEGYRIPRVVVDICAARPIDLAIIDGIESMGGTEGPWSGGEGCHPGVLVAGTNCVNTDAVAAAVMGYDPMARAGESPFNTCDNFLELAEQVGLGTRDLRRIEVARHADPRGPLRLRAAHPQPLSEPPASLPAEEDMSPGLPRRSFIHAAGTFALAPALVRACPVTGRRAKRPALRSCAWASARTRARRRCAGSGRSASTTLSWEARRSRGRRRTFGPWWSAFGPPA